MTQSGTTDRPLRVAVVGAGPSGFYAVEHLQKQAPGTAIDLFDRLPTPFGLVRGGVAPDHPKIKSVTRIYDRVAQQPGFRFLGHVTVGRDVTHEELLAHYDAVVYTVGAQTDRALGIPGEALAGSHAATEFVGWYNGHPDFRDRAFDLSTEAAAVIGLGNVAMDVTRILASRPEELEPTDLAAHALDALRASRVRTIYVLGRRGPVQAAFTNPELRELGELADADVVVDPAELVLDEVSAAELAAAEERTPEKNLATLREYAARPAGGRPRRVVLRFLVSPVELVGEAGRVTGIRVARNRLVPDGRGGARAEATGETELLPVGLVFRSVGYKGVPLPGVPFDERAGTIPNAGGRVLAARDGAVVPRTYVAGWIKRGPSGVIGTNKPCAVESAEAVLADWRAGALAGATAGREALDALLAARGVRVVSWADWQALDRLEQERGTARGAPREKFTRVDEMLAALAG